MKKYKIGNIEDIIVELERRDKNNRKKKYSERISELKSLSEGQEITESLAKFIKRTFSNYQDYLEVVIEEEADVDEDVGADADEAGVGADPGVDDGHAEAGFTVGMFCIAIALVIAIVALIWGMRACGNVDASKNLPATIPTQTSTQAPTQDPTHSSTELPTFKGVAATEKTTEKAKSQQTQRQQTQRQQTQQAQGQQVRTPQQQAVVVEEYVAEETPQQQYIPEPTPTPTPSPTPQPDEEEMNSRRDSTVDEGITGGNQGYGASISGQVESPVPEKIFEAEHPLPPAITQEEIEDISPVVLTPAS